MSEIDSNETTTLRAEPGIRSRLEGLTASQRAALATRLRQMRSTPSIETPTVLPECVAERHEPFALTDVQEAYWVGRRGDFESGEVGSHGYMELVCEALDVASLEEAWNRLVTRHGMLRAVIDEDGRQRILPDVPRYRISTDDLIGMDDAAVKDALLTTRERMSHHVFDTDRWPMFELHASVLDPTSICVHLSIDVLIVDAWSLNVLSRELRTLYNDPSAELPELTLSFRDYVVGTLRLSEEVDSAFERAQRYWLDRLDDMKSAPELPLRTDPLRATNGTSVSRRFTRRGERLDPATWTRLRARCEQFGVTPSVAVLGAYACVLATWSAEQRFTINMTVFDRDPVHPQVDDLVGDFTSVLLLETDLSQPMSLVERVKAIQAQLWRDMDHRQFSGVRVLRELTRRNNAPGVNAIMPFVFTSEIGHRGNEVPFAWLGRQNYTITQTPQVWLDNQIAEDNGALAIDWDSVDELFQEGTLDDMFVAYTTLLRELADSPEAWQANAVVRTPLADRALVDAANATERPYQPCLLHDAFVERARLAPEMAAVLGGGASVSYGELDRVSNRIAHRLIDGGVAVGAPVAIVLRKGWQQVAAVLGVVKAGAAYVPIDPLLPDERRLRLLDQAETAIALSASEDVGGLPWPAWIDVVDIADDKTGSYAESAPAVRASPDTLAYVIFTSGSTGTPKGVMVDHRGAANTVADVNERLNVSAVDRVLALSALNFDLSVYDIFGVLSVGGALVMPDADRHLDTAHWCALIERHGVTLWNSVPALLELLVLEDANRISDDARHTVRHVMLSGDWIPIDLPARCRVCFPEAALLGLGGATEASIWSICYPINGVEPHWKSVPYGKAMRNQCVRVVHADGTLCPKGVPGEIVIGGMGLALGYWRDERRTRESFVSDPSNGERIYLTGDLGRLLPSGDIEFLGRRDFQAKVQGHRIELGEIESTLLRHEEVGSALVTMVGGRFDVKRLVAHIVPESRMPTVVPDPEGLIIDPLAKLQFRLGQHGLRTDLIRDRAVSLDRPSDEAARLARVISRRSCRRFAPKAIERHQLATLLAALGAAGETARPSYPYASAGGLYPVQTYLHVRPNRVRNLDAGTYYYHPLEHRLYSIDPDARIEAAVHDEYNRGTFENSSFSVFFIAQQSAIAPIYGPLALDFCWLESGLMCQALTTEAAEADLGLCQIGGFDFELIRSLFRLDEGHRYLHSILCGPLGAETAEPVPRPSARPAAPLDKRLGDYLRATLPHYMVPGTIMLIDALPLTANGKVDRQALRIDPVESEGTPPSYIAPVTDVEQLIADVWRDVLKIDKAGVEDSFFDLGGNSVQMIRAHNRLTALLGTDMSTVEMFFSYPSIRALAQRFVVPEQSQGAAGEAGHASARKRRALRAERLQARAKKSTRRQEP